MQYKNKTDVKGCSFGHAFKLFWTHYFDFTGKSTRSEYWWWMLWQIIIIVCAGLLSACLSLWSLTQVVTGSSEAAADTQLVAMSPAIILALAIVIPLSAIAARRCNDVGLPLWLSITLSVAYIILNLASAIVSLSIFKILSFIISVVLLVIMLCPSKALDK